jgi:glycosyltransferase involved in cell wall biosynthesis
LHILFHAPMKAPDHPVPSGDRAMARAFVRLFRAAGHQVTVLDEVRSTLKQPGDLDALKDRAAELVAGQIAKFAAPEDRPDFCFTYHNYYKAPDLVGPDIAQGLGIPYVLAEASHAEKRARGAWAVAHRAALHATQRADLHLCLTETDRAGLATVLPEDKLVQFPPFVDHHRFVHGRRSTQSGAPLKLVTVGMMRQRAKLESYAALAASLALLPRQGWKLTIVGDGPERTAIETMFTSFGGKVRFAGALSQGEVALELTKADVFVWPGRSEAYGLVYLEAQAVGLPVVAEAFRAHHAVMQPGQTALVTPVGDPQALADSLATFMTNRHLVDQMGENAARFVAAERSDAAAQLRLSSVLGHLQSTKRVPPEIIERSVQRDPDWPLSVAALDLAKAQGRTVPFWLRDDDAVASTQALDRLIGISRRCKAPLVLAVIPAFATPELAKRVADEAHVWCAPHGWSHTDRAGEGEKRSEFPRARSAEPVRSELEQGWQRVSALFGHKALPLFVPPWNRMGVSHLDALAQAGLKGLSGFGWPKPEAALPDALALRPAHLDIMQWGADRGGRSVADLDRELARHIETHRVNSTLPIGILTHHLVHDRAAWHGLDGLLGMLSVHPAAEFPEPSALLVRSVA